MEKMQAISLADLVKMIQRLKVSASKSLLTKVVLHLCQHLIPVPTQVAYIYRTYIELGVNTAVSWGNAHAENNRMAIRCRGCVVYALEPTKRMCRCAFIRGPLCCL